MTRETWWKTYNQRYENKCDDILNWLASGMKIPEILSEFDELTQDDIFAAFSYAADRENKIYQIAI